MIAGDIRNAQNQEGEEKQMKEVICCIGGKEQGFLLNDRLADLMIQTYKAIRLSRRAQVGKHGDTGQAIHISPMFVYVFEEVLDLKGFTGTWQEVFMSFPIPERKILYAIFREGKTLETISCQLNESPSRLNKTIRKFIDVLDSKVRGKI